VAEALGSKAASTGAELVVTGEGKLDASSLEGKVVGGVLAWAADLGVPRVAVIAGQVADDARTAITARAGVDVLALTDRVWQAGEAYSRAALLVEEAAVEGRPRRSLEFSGRGARGTRRSS
jgi:glycerate kinase